MILTELTQLSIPIFPAKSIFLILYVTQSSNKLRINYELANLMSTITRTETGRKQATGTRKQQPTEADYERLQRLLNRPWSPFKALNTKEIK